MGKLADMFRGVTLAQDQKRQILALDQEYENMKAQIQKLEAENLKLQAEINPTKRELERVTQEKARHGVSPLDEISEKILIALSELPPNGDATANNLASHLGLNVQVIQFHLDELDSTKHANAIYIMNRETGWTIDHEGRKYLIQRGLLK